MQADLAAELRPLLLDRLARTLERLARELPGEETLPDEAARARLAGWQQKRLEVLDLFANARGNAGPKVDASLHTTAADLNGWLLVDEADALRPKRRGEGEGTPLRVAELLELAAAGAADLVEINALALADMAHGLHLPWLALDAAAGWPWTAARPDGWAIYGRAMMALHAPERSQALTDTETHRERAQLSCWALRVLLRWTWTRSGKPTPAGLLPEEELATVGWSPGLDFQTVHRWTDQRVSEAPFPYWMDLLPENTQLGSGTQPFGWLIPRTTPALGIAAFHAAWLASPETRAWETMKALAAANPGEVHHAIAGGELAAAGAADSDNAIRNLAAALVDELRQARKALELDGEAPPAPGARELDGSPGLLWLDELGARFLERIAPEGEELARAVREKAAERWQEAFAPPLPGIEPPPAAALWTLWLPTEKAAGGSLFASLLARALWARMQAELEEERKRAKQLGAPALPRHFVLSVTEALRHAGEIAAGPCEILDPHHLGPTGAIALVEDWQESLKKRKRGALEPELLAQRILQTLNTVAAARLPRLIANTVNVLLRRGRDPRILDWEHGLEGLGKALLLTPEQVRDLPDALDAYRIIDVPLADGSTQHGLWLWRTIPHAPGRAAILRVELPIVWLAGFAAMLKAKDLGTPEDRRLVYLSPPERTPPRVGNSGRAWPAQERLVLIAHREFADRSRELAAEGGLNVSDAEWRRWADEAGIGKRGNVLDQIKEDWLLPTQEPFWPLLQRLPSGLLRMADEEVHRCLVEQGASRNARSKAGKAPRKGPEKRGRKGRGETM